MNHYVTVEVGDVVHHPDGSMTVELSGGHIGTQDPTGRSTGRLPMRGAMKVHVPKDEAYRPDFAPGELVGG